MKSSPSLSSSPARRGQSAARPFSTFALAGVLVGVLALGGHSARADSIGINFNATNAAGNLANATSAGVVAQTNFNNLAGVSGTNAALRDNNNAATTTTLTYTAAERGISAASPMGGDEILNNATIRAAAATPNTPIDFTLNGISYGSYDLYIYIPNMGSVDQQTTLGATSYFSRAPGATSSGYVDSTLATAYTYTRATSTTMGSPTSGADYVLFTGLSGTSQTFSVTGLTGAGRVAGIQVVATPEPSTWAMMAFGVGAMCFVVRRKRSEPQDSTDLAGVAI